MVTLSGNPVVGDVSLTTAEETINIDSSYTVLLYADNDVQVSFHDNQHYKKLTVGVLVPVSCSSGIKTIYAKTISGTATLGVWGMR